ncbi:hypothetical protein LTR08_007157 [Meristemomyces frigidus]|nr:hypothetical protein LTR08_007157 [Meristemomyces frigidus]
METVNLDPRSMLGPGAIVAIAIAALGLVGLTTFLTAAKDPQEPPFLPSTIPVIGHLIHMFREGADYYTKLYQEHHQGLFTIPVFRGRLYIVGSPEWAIAFNKAHKTLSFNEPVVKALKKIFMFDERTSKIVEENMNDEKGDRSGVMLAIHDMLFSTLRSGSGLDELSQNFLDELAPRFQTFARNGDAEQVKLWSLIRQHFSLASLAAIYGRDNPFALNPALLADFWEFEANISTLYTTPYPSIFAPKVFSARRRLFDSMIEYAKKRQYEQASILAQNRARINLSHGFSTEFHGIAEVGMMHAVLANTAPSAFWLLSYVFADPQLLAEVREEVDQCVSVGTSNKCTINITKLKAECPLFFSVMREVLRMVASVNINRMVMEDTPLTNHRTGETYVLKKGNMVQVASTMIHGMSEVYGVDVATFNPRRFISTTEKTADPAAAFRDANGKIIAGSFRTFGGGNNVCPGRHFAQTEMQALAALFVAGFEIESADGGQYVPPQFLNMKMPVAQSVIKPATDVDVNVRRRAGYEATEWEFEM